VLAFDGSSLSRFAVLTLGVVLVAACVTDLRTRRIPNGLALFSAVAGLGFSWMAHGAAGLVSSVTGVMIGLAIWLPFWWLHMMGGGDVKLFAAGSAWLGPAGAVEAALLAGLCGGVLSLCYVIRRHGARHTLIRLATAIDQPQLLREPSRAAWDDRIPYALAMAAGVAGAARWPGLLW
jgi:prepilin peptidase CpaA